MLSQEPRCSYREHQLGEVICQLRFPEILAIGAEAPVAFQEAIRGEYPGFLRRQDTPPPKVTGAPGRFVLENPQPIVNYQFTSMDGVWRVNLTSTFISLTCTHYTGWEDFAARLDKPLAAFIRIYKPGFFQRVGLRYLNFISRKALQLEGVPFSQLISPCYLGPLAEDDVQEGTVTRCSVDAEVGLRGGCRAKIHAGPGLIRKPGLEDKEVKFVLDLDLFLPGQLAVNLSAGALQTLHANADMLFRGAITDRLHEAMDPREL